MDATIEGLFELVAMPNSSEGIVDIAEGVLNDIFIPDERLIARGLRLSVGSRDAAAGKDRASDIPRERPGSGGAGEKPSECRTAEAGNTRQRNAREVESARHADERVRGNEL